MISPFTFLKSLRHALRGLREIFLTEHSFRIQVFATLLVLFCVVTLDLELWKQILLMLLCAAVLVLEILNSIIERVADAVHPRLSPMVKDVKDMMAGGVLLTAITSFLIGFIILYPPMMKIACAILLTCKP